MVSELGDQPRKLCEAPYDYALQTIAIFSVS